MSATAQVARERCEADQAERCVVCEHTLSSHDMISHRFCQATQAHAHSRRCICR